MSDAFNKFLSEYNATGRQKLDGYTLSYLDLLKGDERQQATDLLREETIRDGMGIEGLVHINPDVALKTLLQVEQEWPEARTQKSYDLYYWLWKLTNDEGYAAKFCVCRPFLSDASVTPFYAHASWIVESPTIQKMLREAIFTETDSTGLSTAAGALLENAKISFDKIDTKERHRQLWKQMTKGTSSEKKSALNAISIASVGAA
jgi:hypothetical protein